MDNLTLGFIGGGNMARSLIGGLIADGRDPATILVSDVAAQQLDSLKTTLAVQTTSSNKELAEQADIIVLAVKPQMLKQVATELADVARRRDPLFLSIAAGIRANDINRWLGGEATIVRAMPNTPSLIQAGATALVANSKVSQAQRDQAESIMRAVGIALWLDDEEQMDTVTALSGSGPAYFFLFMEALEQAAISQGLGAETARLLTLQTGFGATKMALESSEPLSTLRQRVTSPGGTTEQAIEAFEKGGIRQLVDNALKAARDRSIFLADELGEEK